jgi:hypothetical protein
LYVWARGWQKSRHTILYSMWSTLAKSPARRPAASVKWYGYKTPYHKRFWSFYSDFFEKLTPRFVFCVRNFVDHHLSAYAMTSKSIEQRATLYHRSLDIYADMKTKFPDQVSLFILDDLADGGVDYVRSALYDDLGIPVGQTTVEQIDPGRRANDSKSKGRVKRDLTRDEREFLKRNADLSEALDALRAGGRIAVRNR